MSSWLGSIQRIPTTICDLMIASLEGNENENASETNLYTAAKNRFNLMRAGISNDNKKPQTIGEQFGSVRRALTAYWMEKKWEAGSRTAGILGLTTLTSANMVWLASASGKLTDSFVAYINNTADPALLTPLMEHGALVGGLSVLLGTIHAISDRLEVALKRDMGSWIVNKFSSAALKDHGIIYRLSHNDDPESEAPDAAPDSPLNRIMDAARDMPDEILNISKGT